MNVVRARSDASTAPVPDCKQCHGAGKVKIQTTAGTEIYTCPCREDHDLQP